jgi:hypothetical protein
MLGVRFVVVAVLALSGCSVSYITSPHQPYAALLDHAGQLDISARAGAIATNTMTGAVQAAYAPIDNLEIAGSVDVDVVDGDTSRTAHGGGGLAIGTFTRTDVLRAELLVGGNGGFAQGSGSNCADRCMTTETFGLSGPYGQAFIQGAIGFEIPYFEFAGGLRFFSNSVQVHAVGSLGTDTTFWYTRGFVDPYLTMRVPIDWFRIELLAGWPVSLGGTEGALPGSVETGIYPYATLGVGVQLDTMSSPILGRDQYLAPATQ